MRVDHGAEQLPRTAPAVHSHQAENLKKPQAPQRGRRAAHPERKHPQRGHDCYNICEIIVKHKELGFNECSHLLCKMVAVRILFVPIFPGILRGIRKTIVCVRKALSDFYLDKGLGAHLRLNSTENHISATISM